MTVASSGWLLRSSRSQMFFKIDVLKNFAKFLEKYLSCSLFLIILQAWRLVTLLKRDFNTGVFLWILRNSKNSFFIDLITNSCFTLMQTFADSSTFVDSYESGYSKVNKFYIFTRSHLLWYKMAFNKCSRDLFLLKKWVKNVEWKNYEWKNVELNVKWTEVES